MSRVPGDLGPSVREALHEVIRKRRDVRLFRAGLAIPEDVLLRVLDAAHHAPSVGYSQPWDFLVIRDLARRQRIRESFLRCRAAEAARYPSPRREQYLAYRLEGIVESSLNLCVTVDLRPTDEAVLGSTAQPESLRGSASCAVQNLWLAARAEGIGVGWVSIVEPAVLRAELALPPGVEPVAYLCLGYPVEFRDRPMLEETGWRGRRPLEDTIHHEQFSDVRQPDGRVRNPDGAPTISASDGARISASDGARISAGDGARISAGDGARISAGEEARAHQARLCKPPGSLGRLEDLAVWYATARGRFPVEPPARTRLYVMAGDHGVTIEGVSPYSSSLTAAMVGNFLAGGAAVNALATESAVELAVVDIGVAGDLTTLPPEPERRARFVPAKVRAGSGNLRRGPAMTRAEAEISIEVGVRCAEEAARDGVDLLCAGEMGIGNSTAAAALLCALAGVDPEEATGHGTGLDEAGRGHKVQVVRDALARLGDRAAADPITSLAEIGGLEIAALAGLMLGGATARLPVVVDGFICAAAALVAVRVRPEVRENLCLSHQSAERGARAMANALGLTPVLDLGLRLGEGTGAVLVAQLIRAAVAAQRHMATFSTAGVPDRRR